MGERLRWFGLSQHRRCMGFDYRLGGRWRWLVRFRRLAYKVLRYYLFHIDWLRRRSGHVRGFGLARGRCSQLSDFSGRGRMCRLNRRWQRFGLNRRTERFGSNGRSSNFQGRAVERQRALSLRDGQRTMRERRAAHSTVTMLAGVVVPATAADQRAS
jgi:hypothetical protein